MRTLLKFEADWCGPCQQIKPLVNSEIGKRDDIKLMEINIDNAASQPLVQAHSVRAIPTLVLLDEDNKVIRSHRGALSSQELSALLSA